jgi:hypothetical protein
VSTRKFGQERLLLRQPATEGSATNLLMCATPMPLPPCGGFRANVAPSPQGSMMVWKDACTWTAPVCFVKLCSWRGGGGGGSSSANKRARQDLHAPLPPCPSPCP